MQDDAGDCGRAKDLSTAHADSLRSLACFAQDDKKWNR
jgi:hypothetical protein